MDINRYLREHEKITEYGWYQYRNLAPSIKCADGLKLSVQASETHYCSPRNNYGPWGSVEVGFPSQVVEELLPWRESRPSKWDQMPPELARFGYRVLWKIRTWNVLNKVHRIFINHPCNSVYGWVPVEIVEEVIEKHGGVRNEEN